MIESILEDEFVIALLRYAGRRNEPTTIKLPPAAGRKVAFAVDTKPRTWSGHLTVPFARLQQTLSFGARRHTHVETAKMSIARLIASRSQAESLGWS